MNISPLRSSAVYHAGVQNASDLDSWLIKGQNTAQSVVYTPSSLFNNTHDISWTLPKPQIRNKPISNLPEFDGTGSLKLFKQRFLEICYMSGIDNEREKAFWLKQSLKGQAEHCYREDSNLNKFWERLETRFGDHLLIQRYLHILPNRKRQYNESLADLSSDIRRMSDIVYDGVPFAQKERLAIQHFLSALNDPQASYDVSCKNPETLEMAMELAIHRELFFGATLDNGSCFSYPSFIHGQPAGSHMGNPGPISQ